MAAGITSILKTAAERGRLQSSVARSLNYGFAAVAFFVCASFLWAQRHGVSIRPLIFWPLVILFGINTPACIALARMGAGDRAARG